MDEGSLVACTCQTINIRCPNIKAQGGRRIHGGGLASVGALGECWEWLGNACLVRAGVLYSKIWPVVGRGLKSVAERAVSGREAQVRNLVVSRDWDASILGEVM